MTALDPKYEMFQKLKEKAAEWGDTQIVFSFGARGGGMYFVQWLRWELGQRLGIDLNATPNAIFMDTVAMKQFLPGPDEQMTLDHISRIKDTSLKGKLMNLFMSEKGSPSPTTKLTVRPGGAANMQGLAPLNDFWEELYINAIRQAHTMIFVATKEWYDSQWCSGELHHFNNENKIRQHKNKPLLRGLCIRFEQPDFNPQQSNVPSQPGSNPMLLHRYCPNPDFDQFWILQDADLTKLVSAVARG